MVSTGLRHHFSFCTKPVILRLFVAFLNNHVMSALKKSLCGTLVLWYYQICKKSRIVIDQPDISLLVGI